MASVHVGLFFRPCRTDDGGIIIGHHAKSYRPSCLINNPDRRWHIGTRIMVNNSAKGFIGYCRRRNYAQSGGRKQCYLSHLIPFSTLSYTSCRTARAQAMPDPRFPSRRRLRHRTLEPRKFGLVTIRVSTAHLRASIPDVWGTTCPHFQPARF